MTTQGLLRNRRLIIATILMLALVIVILIAQILADKQPGTDTIINDAASVICASIAAGFYISVWLTMSSKEVYKKIWGWVTLGIILWTIAEIIWGYYEVILGIIVPYPSIADLFWLSGYIPVYVALSIGYRTFHSTSSRRQMLAIILAVLLFSAASVFLVIMPILQSFDPAKILESMITLAYPLADSALFILTLTIVLAMEKGRFALPWQLFGAGLMFEAIGDLTFSYATQNGIYYPADQLNFISGFVDTTLRISYLLMGLAIFTYSLISELRSTNKINLELRSLAKSNILVFITSLGKILSVSDNLSNLVGSPVKTSYIGLPLGETLRINESEVANLIKETAECGSVSAQPLSVTDSNGSSKDIWYTSLAINDEKNQLNCIALVLRANLDLNGDAEIPLKEDQRMLVEHYLTKAGTKQTEENQILKTYFLEQINLLYSLVQQFSGGKMADTLLMHLQQVARRNNWQFSYDGHNITIPEEYQGQVMAGLFAGLLLEAKNFVADRTSLKMVEQEMVNLDKSLGQDTLRYVDQYNLRSLGQPAARGESSG
jgi:hypothetical protein